MAMATVTVTVTQFSFVPPPLAALYHILGLDASMQGRLL